MDSDAAPLLDRILHARAEVLLRRAIREDFVRVAKCEQTPLVVVGHDRSRHQRWVAGGGVELLAAVAGELDPVAAGCLLVERAGARQVVGTALTVSAAGARAFALDATLRRLGRPRVAFGRQADPAGLAAELSLALIEALDRADRLRGFLPR